MSIALSYVHASGGCANAQVKQLDELERLLEGERMALQREREDAFLLRAQTLVQSYNSSS